jgi:uncharacterized membrane protein
MITPLRLCSRVLFAVPIMVFGAQYFASGHFAGGLPPVPPWAPGGAPAAYFTGAFLVATGLSILAGVQARFAATILGAFFLLCVVALQAQKFSAIIHDGTARTRAFEPLAIGAAAWVLAAMLPADTWSASWNSAIALLAKIGLYLFAFSMVIFGAQHFMYAPFIAFLIPTWMPAHLFLVYFTGAAMVAAGLAMATGILARSAGIWLGVMFLLWVILLHAPRVLAKPHNADEWTSLFVAMCMAGCSFILAEGRRKKLNAPL